VELVGDKSNKDHLDLMRKVGAGLDMITALQEKRPGDYKVMEKTLGEAMKILNDEINRLQTKPAEQLPRNAGGDGFEDSHEPLALGNKLDSLL
jgi:hypothetical protein